MPDYFAEEFPGGYDEVGDTLPQVAPMPPERKEWFEKRYRNAMETGGMQAMYGQLEEDYGLPRGFMAQMALVESAGLPNAQSGSFKGLFQLGPKILKQFGIDESDAFDPVKNSWGGAMYAAENFQKLPQKLGREVRPWELYMAHQMGLSGYSNLARNANAKLSDLGVIGRNALNQKVRGITGDSTAGQFLNVFRSRYTDGWGDWAYQPDGGLGFDPTMYAGSWFDPNSGTGYYDGAGNFVWEPTPLPSVGVNNFGMGPQPGLEQAVYYDQPANTQPDMTYAAAPSFVDNYAAPSPYYVAPPAPSFADPNYAVGYASYPAGGGYSPSYYPSNNSGSPGGYGGGSISVQPIYPGQPGYDY
jgi:hypothetical protein